MPKPVHTHQKAITEYLERHSVQLRALSDVELAEVSHRWLERFASRVKRQKKTWVHCGFKWHGFSYGIEPSLSGDAAQRAYHKTKGSFYIFDEAGTYGYLCKPKVPFRPELSHLRADIYVTSASFSWTMVFTHEEPHQGPLYAE